MTDSYLFNGISIRNIKVGDLSTFLTNIYNSSGKKHVHLLAASSVVSALDDKDLTSIFNSGFSLCDSAPLARIVRLSIPDFNQIRGSDLLREAIKKDQGKVNHFFIVPNLNVYKYIQKYALKENNRIKICGGLVPEFSTDFSSFYENWAAEIKEVDADYIWIGLGSPKQDRIASELSKLTGKLCIAIGAAIEFVSGEKKEAPKILQSLYLEWLFRLFSDPKRLLKRYTVQNIIFMRLIFSHLTRK
jgi:N-acetylglucosaminyldiphosphoundecaprenol N-acetyl-beta-D-mannosaminyltransferase